MHVLNDFLKDVRYGIRGLLRTPGFSLVVILTFALGVGINTAVFSVVRSVLLKPLPYPAAERLVRLGESAGRAQGISVSWGNFLQWQAQNHSFESLAGFMFTQRTLTGRGEPVVTNGMLVTAPYFGLTGMHPLMGRLFGDSDDKPGAAPVIVLDYGFWQRQFGGDPQVAGSTVALNGSAFEVAGVAAPTVGPWKTDYYLALGRAMNPSANRAQHGSIRALGRLKPGVTLSAATADLDGILQRLAAADPGPENGHRSWGEFLAQYATGDIRGTLLVLFGAATLILLIACANIASLLLARSSARTGELAVRQAIGAGRRRLVRQLLAETFTIAAAGGLAGIALAVWTVRLLIAMAPAGLPRLAEIGIDLQVLLFACCLTAGAGLIAGMAPVVLAGRIDLLAALKEGARVAGLGKRRQAARNSLVVAEVALTFMLAFGSGLLLRSLIAAQNSNPGFDARRLLSFSLQLPGRVYNSPQQIAAFYSRLRTGMRAIPGVRAATAVSCPPGAGDCGDWFYSLPDHAAPPPNEVPVALFNTADAGYFGTLHATLREGREFNDTDVASGPKVAVVNESFARRWWPHEPAVGRRIKVGGPYREGDMLEIVGVVADIRQFGLDAEPMAEVYQPFSQERSGGMTILLRTAGEPSGVAPAVRQRVLALDRNLPLQHLQTIEEAFGEGLARRRFSTLLLSVFAFLAMVLAGIGIYGLLSYWVSSREPEIAVRLALGARPATILRWTGMKALRLTAIGLLIGGAGCVVGARSLRAMVFGTGTGNPAVLAAAAFVVLAIALLAAVAPAWRAARVNVAQRLHRA